MVAVGSAALLASLGPLADAMALHAVGAGFRYGRTRGAGAASFIAATLASGYAVAARGIAVITLLHAGLLAITVGITARITPSKRGTQRGASRVPLTAALPLFRSRSFLTVVLVAALVQGSHALHDSFAILRWREAGIGADVAGLLWAETVAGEVLVFFVLERLPHLGPWGACLLSAGAGGVALVGDGADRLAAGDRPGAAPAWTDLRPGAPGEHAIDCRGSSGAPQP